MVIKSDPMENPWLPRPNPTHRGFSFTSTRSTPPRFLFYSHPIALTLTLLVMLFLFSASVAGVLLSRSTVVHALCGGMMGLLWIPSGWMGHDSGHYRIVSDPRLNRFAQIVTGNCLTGISIAWWKRNHNAHHIACNSLNYDPDLQHMQFFVVSSKLFASLTSCYYDRKMNFDAVMRFLVSYQHWTFYPVMGFARINLFAQSILLLVSKMKVPNRWQEILGVSVFWIWWAVINVETLVHILGEFVKHVKEILGIDIKEMLVGASLMDEATRSPVVKNNPAALLALCWYWASDGVGSKDMVVVPYKDSLLLFSRYLQQLVMESLGKEFDLNGNRA